MYRTIADYAFFIFLSGSLLSGCDLNNDVAMLSSYPKHGHCSIESPARGTTITLEQELSISGWAYDENHKTIPDTLTMYFINEDTNEITVAMVKRGGKREDVARVLGSPHLINSGFSGTINKAKLSAGKYQLILLQADQKNGVISCAGEAHKIVLQ